MGPEALNQRPHLCTLVMQVIARWSFIEVAKSNMLSVHAGTSDDTGLALYQSVRSPAAQSALLNAAAAQGLKCTDIPLFKAAMRAIGTSAKRRHAFAHHLWGITEGLPDSLLLVDPKTFLPYLKSARDNKTRHKKVFVKPWPYYDLSKVTVFTKDDLLSDAQDASLVEDWVMLLTELSDPSAADGARQELSTSPRIQQLIRTQ